VLVRVPAPYDFELSMSRYRDLGSDGATVWRDAEIRRVFAGRELRLTAAAGGVLVEPGAEDVRSEVERFLGLPFDVRAFRAFAPVDDVLARVVDVLSGLRPPLVPDPFEALVVAITTQQISLRAAAAIRGNLVRRFGTQHEVAWAFPTRARLARARPSQLLVLGFSTRKAEYVIELARSDLDFDALAASSDDAVIAALTAVRGLGRWTADWFLARHLARPHAWPAGDLGLRKAMSSFYAAGRPLSIEEVRRMGERFAPFQNLSAQFLLVASRLGV
jgi:DNA-3-methyladenine glycosylase II